MKRVAHYCCGTLRIEADGDPAAVVACHCGQCQRRTGSVLGVGAHYPSANIRVYGPCKLFTRLADSGRKFETHFCPGCGSSLYWESERNSGMVGVAVGEFTNPQFPEPVRSV
jgi:hypothetical protein